MTSTLNTLAVRPPAKGTRADQLLGMLTRKQGATLPDIIKVTAWKPHTARAALRGLRKRGFQVSSEKPEGGIRTYHSVCKKA